MNNPARRGGLRRISARRGSIDVIAAELGDLDAMTTLILRGAGRCANLPRQQRLTVSPGRDGRAYAGKLAGAYGCEPAAAVRFILDTPSMTGQMIAFGGSQRLPFADTRR